MTEQEYIDATNLAKLRLAIHALSQTLTDSSDAPLKDEALTAMYRWQDALEKVVTSS